MDFASLTFAVIAAVVAAIGLAWHFTLAKKGRATGRDRLMGGVWAALLVLSLGRILWISGGGDAPKPAPAVPSAPSTLPK